MSSDRRFREDANKSSDKVDNFLDELAQGQHAADRPNLDDRDAAIVSEWEGERTTDPQTAMSTGSMTGGGQGTSSSKDKGQQAASTAKDKGEQAASAAKDKGEKAASAAKDKGQEAMSTAKDKASDATDQAQAKADDSLNKAASGMGQAADKLRQQGEGSSGAVGSAATTAADTLDSASSYLKDKDTDQLVQDLEALIRRKPVESLLVAAGAGFVLSKLLG